MREVWLSCRIRHIIDFFFFWSDMEKNSWSSLCLSLLSSKAQYWWSHLYVLHSWLHESTQIYYQRRGVSKPLYLKVLNAVILMYLIYCRKLRLLRYRFFNFVDAWEVSNSVSRWTATSMFSVLCCRLFVMECIVPNLRYKRNLRRRNERRLFFFFAKNACFLFLIFVFLFFVFCFVLFCYFAVVFNKVSHLRSCQPQECFEYWIFWVHSYSF